MVVPPGQSTFFQFYCNKLGMIINGFQSRTIASWLTTGITFITTFTFFIFFRLGSVDGGLLLLLLFSDKRSASKVTTVNSNWIAAFNTWDTCFSLSSSVVTSSMVLVILTVVSFTWQCPVHH